jgi:versiconal hemiacetal acetate esterase
MLANYIVQDPSKKAGFKGIAAITPCSLHWDSVHDEYKSMYTAYEDNKQGTPIIDKTSMEIFYDAYGADPKDPNTFVALASENHQKFPPTYFVSCEFDPLRDDAYVMEAALKKAGVPTKHDHYKGFPHYFWIFPSVPEGKEVIGNLIGGIKWFLAQS